NGVPGTDDLRPFQAGNGPDKLFLDRLGKAGGEPGYVNLVRTGTLRFDEDLVARAIGKIDDLPLDRRTITGAHARNCPAIHGGLVQILPDNLMGPLIGISQPAGGRQPWLPRDP